MEGRVRRRLASRLGAWSETLDPSEQEAFRLLRPWLGIALGGIVLLAVATGPGARGGAGPPGAAVLATLLPLVAVAGLTLASARRGRLSPAAHAGLAFAGGTAIVLHAASFPALARAPLAGMLAAFPILVAAYEGHRLRATLDVPFVPLGLALAFATPYVFFAEPANAGLGAVALTLGVGSAIATGTRTRRLDVERARVDALRAALEAQRLEERARELARLSTALDRILERNHDASNALSTSLLSADYLLDLAKGDVDAGRRDDLYEVALQLREALGRLKELVDETRELGRAQLRRAVPGGERVVPFAVAEAVVTEARRSFPDVALACRASGPRAESLAAQLWGGPEALRAALEHVVRNACEAGGPGAAGRVEVVVRDDARVGALALEIRDDGPGFAEAQLAEPIRALGSTKPGASGLGLYTAERLIRAGGGSLDRANRPEGGAVVRIYLAEAPAAGAPGA